MGIYWENEVPDVRNGFHLSAGVYSAWRSSCRLQIMSIERIFNIFIYFQGGTAMEYGVRHHRVGGTDQEKTGYLLTCIVQDHPIARRFSFPRSFTPDEWLAVFRLGRALEHFEEAFTLFKAPVQPVFCITPIVDGEPKVEKQIGPEPYRGDAVTAEEGWGGDTRLSRQLYER